MELCMSAKERDRLRVMNQMEKRQLTQREGANQLRMSERQVRRLWKRYQQEGDGGLVHKLRVLLATRARMRGRLGRPPNGARDPGDARRARRGANRSDGEPPYAAATFSFFSRARMRSERVWRAY